MHYGTSPLRSMSLGMGMGMGMSMGMDPRMQMMRQSNLTANAVPPEEDQPKRPLSAYNIFFQVERQRLISDEPMEGPYTRAEVYSINLDKATRIEKSKRPHRKMHGRITFIELAKSIAQKWKTIDAPERKLFEERADDEKRKYAIELEDYLLRQLPTQQVKKRLSALRRGSLSKYIKGREKTASPVQTSSPGAGINESNDGHSVHTISREVSPTNSIIHPQRRRSTASFIRAPVLPERRQLQMERGRNLERLYQMQIQLYNEQMRLQAEYNRDQAAGNFHHPEGQNREQHLDSPRYEQDYHHDVAQPFMENAPSLPSMNDGHRFVSQESFAENPLDDSAFTSHHDSHQNQQHHTLDDTFGSEQHISTPYEHSPHPEDGRVSPLHLGTDPFV